ncbi:hypothetical protein Btru_012707 [Bulinus truncatus]|nr:hypothetical protein Btru_012707 [Bulinus truncatus]
MDVELQATCSALGYLEGKEYIKEPDCIETVKDLIRFLRRDNDICEIRRQLGHTQILQNDLTPLLKFYHKDKPLFETVVKLLVNLTQPVITCWNNQIPDEKTLRHYCIEVEGYLQDYKECTEDDASTHDRILWTIHTSGVEDLLLFVASSERERSMLCMHILEIISLMFKEQEAEALASAGVQRSLTEKEKDQRELEQAREKEKAQKKANILKFSGRHSRFGGTYVIKNMKSISENDVIYHKSLGESKSFSYDEGKAPKKVAKNRVAIKGDAGIRRSTLSMRLILKEFCVQFLINSYNPLMRAVKEALTRKTAQDNDETYYLWAMRYFMEFCRLHCKRIDLVSETMSMSAFHYIYIQLSNYHENIRLIKDVEEAKVWGRRTHMALKAYQELLRTLDFMSKSPDEQIRQSAKVIQSNVFYMFEYRDIFVLMLKNFKESKCSRSYLQDLIESAHIFLKMLETFSKSSKLVVQKKKHKQKKRARNRPAAVAPIEEPTEEQLTELWDSQASSEIQSLLQGHPELPEGLSPFDAASEVDVDEQSFKSYNKNHLCASPIIFINYIIDHLKIQLLII